MISQVMLKLCSEKCEK